MIKSLIFNHNDASGALTGDAANRTAEYSPLRRNVADASPYITLNTAVEPDEGGVNMFGSGQGYRPGQTTYRIDGMVVPESQFMEVINSGQIGGAFGLLEMAARMSVRDYSVKFYDGNMQLERFFGSEGDAKNFAFRMNQTTVFKNILVSGAWSVLMAIDIPTKLANTAFDKKKLSVLDESLLKKKVKELLTEKCTNFINTLLAKANEITRDLWDNADAQTRKTTLYKPSEQIFTNIMGLFDTVSKQGGFYGSIDANTATVRGSVQNNNATVYLAGFIDWEKRTEHGNNHDISLEESRSGHKLMIGQQALTTIHELLHFNFGDVDLANAVAKLNGDRKSNFSFGDTSKASPYWSAELKKHCGPQK